MPGLVFEVNDMSCGSCVATVTRALLKVRGVSGVHVDLERGQVCVVTQEPVVEVPALLAAFKAAGYTAVPMDAAQSGESAPGTDGGTRGGTDTHMQEG